MDVQRRIADSVIVPARSSKSSALWNDLDLYQLLESLPAGAYSCDAQGQITYFNRHAAQLWGREPKLHDATDRFCGSPKLFAPDGSPIAHDQCWMALALKHGKQYNREEIVIQRPSGERRTVLVHANPVHDESGRVVGAVSALIDITDQKQAEEAARRRNALLAEQVTERRAALEILHEVTVAANEARSVDDAMLVALQRVCDYKSWTFGHVWLRSEDEDGGFSSSRVWYCTEQRGREPGSLRVFQRIAERTRIPVDGTFIGRVARTAEPFWVDDVCELVHWRRGDPRRFGLTSAIAFPVQVHGDVVAVLEFLSSRTIECDEGFLEIMADVGIQLGHVLERKRLEKAIADATAGEKRRIANELHDSVSQLLSGAAMLGESLRQALGDESSPHVKLATRLVEHMRQAQQQVRQVSRGLMPVESDAAGLMKALEQLARGCTDLFNVSCIFTCDDPVLIDDNRVATQLYYIAREALYNSCKYAAAKTIVVRLLQETESIQVMVEDDGKGITRGDASTTGMGMNIMRYRASVLGAKLDVVSSCHTGTKVICTLPAIRIAPNQPSGTDTTQVSSG